MTSSACSLNAEQLVEIKTCASRSAKARTSMSKCSKSCWTWNDLLPDVREKVGGSRMITSNLSPLRASRGNTDLTSSAMKRWSTVGRLFSAKFSRPRSRYFLDRSTLKVLAPLHAAHTEKEQ